MYNTVDCHKFAHSISLADDNLPVTCLSVQAYVSLLVQGDLIKISMVHASNFGQKAACNSTGIGGMQLIVSEHYFVLIPSESTFYICMTGERRA